MGTTTKLHVARRVCDAATADAIKRALTHARVAGLLQSYEDNAFWDGTEVLVMLSCERLHPSERDYFALERDVADRIVAKTVPRPTSSSIPPRGA